MAHAKLTRRYVTAELDDGTVHEDIRILFKDIAAYMKAARINRWDPEDGVNQGVFTVWHAGKRDGRWDFTFEDFRDNQLLDMDSEDVLAEDDKDTDPTPAS